MGEVVLSSEEAMAMEMELETKKNETKKDGSSEVVRWERFLPRMVLRVLLVEANDSARHIIFVPLRKCSYTGITLECLNGEFIRVGPNSKFSPVAGYHWFDGDGMIHGVRINDGRATYVSRFVKTSRLKQEEFFGGAKFTKIGDLKGLFGLFMAYTKMLRENFNVLDLPYGFGGGRLLSPILLMKCKNVHS
ncbi:hypothetical protein Pint_04265 [Pistacia integerrima]|uniref:Uncharacterized protein n=1 Tax=Pistacia integerrima TaxID=434235 RepID=A0ACC0Z611_9ROSI|nr:hypothetical protein Pint_04265 [Pistacia integerrima]